MASERGRTTSVAARAERAGGEQFTPRVVFAGDNEFQAALRQRVDALFEHSGRPMRDCPQMYVKTGLILLGFVTTYALLVFAVSAWYLAVPLAILLGLVIALIGFNIMHDGGHGAYSRHPAINRLMAASVDLLGLSSYWWHWNHGVYHHTYTNVNGHDVDIGLGLIRRLSPHQRRRAYHRWQHWYVWPLYGLLAFKWHLFEDVRDLVAGRIGGLRIRRPQGYELSILVGGKLVFFTLAFAIPMLVHSPWVVLAYYGVTAFVLSFALALVFQIAHCVEEAAFPAPAPDSLRIERPWAVHQVETTVDFMRQSRVAAWMLGGLNFQIEHHLFPRVCHVNYPALSKVVEQTCREFGVRYREHRSFWAGMASHYRWLRTMGLPGTAA